MEILKLHRDLCFRYLRTPWPTLVGVERGESLNSFIVARKCNLGLKLMSLALVIELAYLSRHQVCEWSLEVSLEIEAWGPQEPA